MFYYFDTVLFIYQNQRIKFYIDLYHIKRDLYKMSRDVDFIMTNLQNLTKIIRPIIVKPEQKKQKSQSIKTFKIQKSFIPQAKSQINDAIAPQLKQLKQFYKRKIQIQKKNKQLVAQGVITKQQLEGKTKKQQVISVEKVKVDESGQVRDQKGNLLFVKNRTAELNINKKIEENQKLKQLNKKQRIKYHQKLSKNLLDRNLLICGNKKRLKRSMLGLQFMQKGSYQSVSALTQTKRQIESLSDILKNQHQQSQDNYRIIKKRNRIKLQYNREVPQIQWWDKPFLKCQTYKQIIEAQNLSLQKPQTFDKLKIQDYVNIFSLTDQVCYQKVGDTDPKQQKNIIMPMYLTKDQKKKLKRKKKREKLLEKNDMIKLGLIQPQKPRLKIGNMAIVMKDQFIIDPSKIQSQAKKQEQERLNKHLQANNSRKLTKVQKKDKAIRKLKRDSAKECRRAIFKIGKLDDPTIYFKVDTNAKQLALNGFIIKPSDYHRQVVMVAVEGGAKAIRFYKNLMLNRIRWDKGDDNKCVLVWQGTVQNATLGKWSSYSVGDESQTMRILKEKGVKHLWDYVSN